MTLCLSGVAAVFFTHTHAETLVWLLVAYIAFFSVSQGAVIWVYIAEVVPKPRPLQRAEPGFPPHTGS